MKVGKIYLLSATLLANSCLFAQTPTPDPSKFFPQLAPPSPEAASFTRYGNYQVNMFTGVPDISIPIYEIKVGELTVPISLNYHASGMKVTDMPSRVGLGWDLQAGGSITRKIMGRADELPGNYLSATSTSVNRVMLQSEINTSTDDGLLYLKNVDQGVYDVEPDIFSYTFPGHSGKFLFNQKNNFTPFFIPYAPVSVSMSQPTASTLALGMTDESGINYNFGTTEWTGTGNGNTTYSTSAWLLSKMTSSNKQDSIQFLYNGTTGTANTDSYFSDYMTLSDGCTGSYSCNTTGTYNTDNEYVNTSWQQMTEIDFRNGKVVLEAGPETRQDFSGQYMLQNRLNAIKIYSYDPLSNTYTLIRSFTFFQSYFINGTDNATKRLRLDSIQVMASTGAVIQTYKLNYNTSVLLPSKASRQKDYWGYFNNITNLDPNGNPTTIARMQVQYNTGNTAPVNIWIGGDHTNARDPDPNYMQACILQKIVFPTGGFTQFEYETNQYLDANNNPAYAGGLRIKTIKNYTDINATPIVKTYKYGDSESGYGRNNFLLEDHFFVSVQNLQKAMDMVPGGAGGSMCSGIPNYKTVRTYFGNPTNDLEAYDGAPVVYPIVTEYTGDNITNTGKTVYTFLDKTDAKLSVIGYGKPILTSYHFVRGLLTSRSDFNLNTDNTYKVVARNKKTYQYFPYQNSTGGIGLVVFKFRIFEGNDGLTFNTGCESGSNSNAYNFNNYEIVTGDNKLVTDTAFTYDQNDTTRFTAVTTTNTYDDVSHLQTTQTQSNNSKNEIISTALTYPYNYTTAPYTNMTTNHIFDRTVQQTMTNSVSGPLTQKTTNYASFSGNNYLPSNIQLQVKSNPVETRANFNLYDLRGNILEMQKTNDLKQAFIWDYNNVSLIAQVQNAAGDQVAYTSFEADGTGNWTGINTAHIQTDVNSITGSRDYSLTGDTIKKTTSSALNYTVSYWSKNGTYNVNGTSAKQGRSVSLNGQNWTYYEHTVSAPSSISITGSGIIDELRLYPAGAKMTSYTYNSLIGQTSMSDPNGEVVYYEYDTFNRLKNIKDYQGNIIKNFQYNYINSCGNNCVVLPMQTFNGNNTISYPVGVFNVNGLLLGKANSQTQYDSLWNSNTTNQAKGVLSAGLDSLHFNLAIATGQTPPAAVTGLRYYQVDLAYTLIDGIRNTNAAYVDFGDGTSMKLGKTFNDTAVTVAANTTMIISPNGTAYFIHTYPNNNTKTLTFYHSDGMENALFDNRNNPGTSLTLLQNLRGNLPQYMNVIGGSCYQQSSMNTVAGILNWNSMSSVISFLPHNGDGTNPSMHLSYAQDFMANNKGLQYISTDPYGPYDNGYRDTTFKISRLKSNWNTYFTGLTYILINEDHWNHEDLSGLKLLNTFALYATTSNHTDNTVSNPLLPLSITVIDNIFNQIASGAGNAGVKNGTLQIWTGGSNRTSASNAAFTQLQAAGWTITINTSTSF